MNDLYLICLTTYWLAWLVANFRPFQDFLDGFMWQLDSPPGWLMLIYDLLTCQTCLTFWFSIWWMPLWMALMLAGIAQLHTSLKEYLDNGTL